MFRQPMLPSFSYSRLLIFVAVPSLSNSLFMRGLYRSNLLVWISYHDMIHGIVAGPSCDVDKTKHRFIPLDMSSE